MPSSRPAASPSIAPLDLERADASHYDALAEGVRNEFGGSTASSTPPRAGGERSRSSITTW